MTALEILSFLGPVALIVFGLRFRNSKNEHWAASKKWWPFYLSVGILILILKIAAFLI